MPTITELMQGKAPGEIRIMLSSWSNSQWFRPFFVTRKQDWYGITQDDIATGHSAMSSSGWQLYTDPPKTVTMWKWAMQFHGIWTEGNSFHADGPSFLQGFIERPQDYKRLD